MRQSEKKRFADARRIRTIDFARSGIGGTGSLSPRSRRALAVYIVLVKMGFGGIAAPSGAIADAVYRSSHGEAKSIRTLQRANKELEEKGYICSVKYRPGKRARGAVICFCLDAFAFWTKIAVKNVTPLPTQSYISPDATSCHTSDRTRDKVTSNSPDLTKNEHTKPRAGARASQKTSRRKNPVLFSVVIVLSKMAMHRADRRAARARAEIELKAAVAGVELINPSGVDWAYWEKRWPELSIPVRETIASREIVPRLLGRDQVVAGELEQLEHEQLEQLEHEQLEQLEHEQHEQLEHEVIGAEFTSPTQEEIRRVLADLESKFSIPKEKAPARVPTEDGYPEVDARDPEMQLLIEARNRTRSRCVNSG
jgi:hypothetical protein